MLCAHVTICGGLRCWIVGPARASCENAHVDFDLSPDHELIRATVRDFAQGEVAPVAEQLDRTKSFPYDIVAKLGKLNLMGIPFPEEYGGGGGDTLAYALAVEELTRVDSSVAITLCAHTSLGTQPIYLFGTEEQKREWLPRLCSGERLGAFGLTEPEAGSDAGNTRTRARLSDGEWVIDGAKQFITNAGTDISGVVCITAVTGQMSNGDPHNATTEISNLIVPNGTVGYEQGEPYRKMGWNASDTRPLSFSDCRVPEENLLGPRAAGFKQFLHILDIGRIGVAAMGVGLAQGALDQALAYAKQRKAFGKPISKFQAIQGKLADMSTEIAAARLLVYKAAREKDHGRNFTLTAAQAKLKTGRLAVRCAEEAVQIHGGYGYIEEYPVCRFYRDAKILTIGEGTDEVQQMVIARALGA
jgi:alkylation response protein AidB-like acyl-CoA dehydrogenase